MISEPDAHDALIDLRVKVMLVVEKHPNEGELLYPAPYELREQLALGGCLPSNCREATPDELLEYVEINGVPDEPEPVDQAPPHEDWGTW